MSDPSAHYDYCANELREKYYARYLSTLYLPVEIRQVAQALFAFDLEIRRIPHLVSQPAPGEIRIQWWRDQIVQSAQNSLNPIASALIEVVDLYDLPREYFDELLEARIFDLYSDPMPDQAALEAYLGLTRSRLFQLLAQIACSRFATEDLPELNILTTTASGHAGIAIGIVEILNDLAFDYHRQRQFIPPQLSSFEMITRPGGKEMINLDWLGEIIEYGLEHHSRAKDAIDQLPVEFRIIYLPLAIAGNQLTNFRKTGIDLHTNPVQISKIKTHYLLWQAARRLND